MLSSGGRFRPGLSPAVPTASAPIISMNYGRSNLDADNRVSIEIHRRKPGKGETRLPRNLLRPMPPMV
jgi:hypothetical protein